MTRRLVDLTTDNDADLMVLSRANERGKFAVPLDATGTKDVWAAFERGLDNDWFRLIDVAPISAHDGRVSRIFRLTDAGRERLAELKGTKAT